jgi:hypothetical protein
MSRQPASMPTLNLSAPFSRTTGMRRCTFVVGVDEELAAARKFGAFYRTPGTDEPRWSAHVVFKRVAESES